MKVYQRNTLARAVSTALAGSVIATATVAQENQPMLEEITVTAQKRTENLQDVPVSVQVLGNQQLEDLNLDNFGSYIEFLPTVSWQAERPGVAQIYMRGISSGGDGVHSGSMPSVGVYLDEQPITTINHILDLHMYDISRIETLAGPQGTFFGASSQAGTMRIITNAPVIGEYEGGFDLGLNTVKDGDRGYTAEGYWNVPIGERAALRVVGWHVQRGGYIDNVPGSVLMRGVNETINNDALVEDDFNDNTLTGARAQLKVDLNDNWTVTPGLMYQQSDSNGVFFHDPEDVGDLEVQRFFDEFYDDSWYQASLTLDGQVGDMNLVYSAAYLDRDADSVSDYTHYAQYLDNYYALYSGCYHYDGSTLNCTNPAQFISGDEAFTRQSHEVRLQSSDQSRLRWTVGLFAQRQEHDFDLSWNVPDMDPDFNPARLASWPFGTVVPGANVAWQTRQVRVDRDKAAFGELSYDFTDNLTGIVGYRYFDFENSLFGFTGGLNRCLDTADQPQYPCFGEATNVDDVSKGNGESLKFSLNYNLSDDKMIYGTYSEGFRAGGVNRAIVPGIAKYEPDFVNNYEMGWKTTWQDGRLRFNGAAYFLEWENFQFSFLDFAVSPLTIIQNIGQSETVGAEFDLTYAATTDLTLSLSASFNDAELQEPYWRDADDEVAGLPPQAPEGTEMPFVPKLQYTAIARYSMDFGRWPGYLQAALSFTDDSWNNLVIDEREKQSAYTLVNLAAGIDSEDWSLDLFLDNVTDERAQIVRYNANYFDPFSEITQDSAISVNRPRSIGLRYGRRF